jgi:hypothetical protein
VIKKGRKGYGLSAKHGVKALAASRSKIESVARAEYPTNEDGRRQYKMSKGKIVNTYNGSDSTWDDDIKEKLINFPTMTGELERASKTFDLVRKMIQAGGRSTLILGPDLRISRIEDYHNSICVTHKASGYGWGYYYSPDIADIEVQIEGERTVKIIPAKYVWVVIDGDDYMTCDPKYVRSFSTKKAAEEWNKKQKGTVYKFRHYE